MDELAAYNRERWEELAQKGVPYSRPILDLTVESANALTDPLDLLGDATGKRVLCLAGGGGQQSAAFALQGAVVTVLDLTPTQLERDREAAAHYGFDIETVEGDMRDLSCFGENAFDIVWHAHSLSFVPDAGQVFAQVSRVLRPQGWYFLSVCNPFLYGLKEGSWDGAAYRYALDYCDGEADLSNDPYWGIADGEGGEIQVVSPREFRHTVSTLINGLIENGLVMQRMREATWGPSDPSPDPGSWAHMGTMMPSQFDFYCRYHV